MLDYWQLLATLFDKGQKKEYFNTLSKRFNLVFRVLSNSSLQSDILGCKKEKPGNDLCKRVSRIPLLSPACSENCAIIVEHI